MSTIGLIPELSALAQRVIQKEKLVAKTTDTISKAITGPNGLKIPQVSSLQKLLGSLPTGISTITAAVSSFSVSEALNVSLDKGNGLGNFLNSAVGSAQNLGGAITSVVGAASSLGINVDALGPLSQAITGVNPFTRVGGGNFFSMTPSFDYEIPSTSSGFVYPLDLNTDEMECIQLSIAEYRKNEVMQPANYTTESTIFLPIPRNLNEGHSPAWSEFSPGPIRGVLADMANRINKSGGDVDIAAFGKALGGELSDVYETLKRNVDGASTEDKVTQIASALQVGMYYNIVPSFGAAGAGIASNFTGRAVNPYTTVAFQGVNLRQHNFVWVLAPKSPEESARLADILKILRKAALPKDGGGIFLEYPKVVNVKFMPREDTLYNLKRCVINYLNIDHAGSGQPSFFNKTGYPTIYILTLALKEIEQYTSNDVAEPSSSTTRTPDFSLGNIVSVGNEEDDILPPKAIIRPPPFDSGI